MIIGIIALVTGVNDPGVLLQFSAEGSPVIAVLAGVSLAFFAMTGFENAANVAEETIDPARAFPRALIGGMLTAGVVYVLVSISAALAVPIETLAGNTLLEVIRADLFFIPASIMLVVFGLIAMIAISNTTLVTVVAQSRILYGMAREDVVPVGLRQDPPDPAQPVRGAALRRRHRRRPAGDRRGDPEPARSGCPRTTSSTSSTAWPPSPWCSCCSSTRW